MSSAAIEAIERQINHTRSALDRTIRALQVELSPRHRVQVAWHSAKARTARRMRDSANWAVANPLPIGVGAAILIAAATVVAIQRTRR